MAESGYNESIGSLVRGVLADLRQLMRDEVALARVEIREQASRARLAAVSLGTAAAALLIGAIFLLIAIAIGIADVFDWPLWAGYFVVALLLMIGGAIAMASGRKKLRELQPVPEQTVETLKENSEWIAKRLQSASR
jgi:hypothetical protein